MSASTQTTALSVPQIGARKGKAPLVCVTAYVGMVLHGLPSTLSVTLAMMILHAGARHWSLTRDVQEPSRWMESYRTPTWTDYQRLHHRLTLADNLLEQEFLKLNTPIRPPRTTILVERPTGAARKSSPPVPYVSQK